MGRAASRRVATIAFAVSVAAAAACTTFDGITVPDAQDGSASGSDAADAGPSCAPTDSPQALATFADAARACSLIARCPYLETSLILSDGIPADAFSYSLCLQWLAGRVPGSRVGLPLQRNAIACVARAAQDGGADACAAAGACVGYEAIAANDPRCAGDGGAPSKCLGTTDVLRCDYQTIYHCALPDFGPNMTCMKGSDGQYECGSGTCGDAGLSQCLGNLIDGCDTTIGLVSDVNCASTGQLCGDDPTTPGNIACLTAPGQIETCKTQGQVICNGGKVQVCAYGEYSEWDCTNLGETCTMNGGGARCASAEAGSCSPYDQGVDVCNGSVLTACVDGALVCFDCASIGLSCVGGDAGAGGGRCG